MLSINDMQLELTDILYGYTFAEERCLDVNEKYPLGMKVLYKPLAYVFDPDSYIICRAGTDEAKAIEYPLVFPAVPHIEVMRAYVDQLNDRKLRFDFRELNDDDFQKLFWGCFDDGGEKLADVRKFEEYYRYSKIVEWCDENGIAYYIKDENIKKALAYK